MKPKKPQLRLITLLVLLTPFLGRAASGEEKASKDAPTFDDRSLEFFEKEVRPLLVSRCYSCHSGKAKKIMGGLRLDSRAAALRGGDTGPAIVPKSPKESLLVDAVEYGDLYQMPPKSKLANKDVAALIKWVELGAPWPAGESVASDESGAFDLEERKAAHWAWRGLTDPARPDVKNNAWPGDPLDYFILAKLEAKGLSPAASADKRTLIRRVTFDLVGIPPTPRQVADFLADDTPQAFERVVDRLLQSEQFGERWSRHWLDLVRYAESRGHEFDYDTPNSHQYRDYVIRALNLDLPYDQFVTEHIAGDLLQRPRLHPEQGFNESILGTGFWFLGEWVHSPVDTRKDETDRFDNMTDVFGKTFLGLTIACARCHDHKFDAISQADYYAMFGFLQSSAYRQARFDSLHHNQRITRQLEKLREETRGQLAQLFSQTREASIRQTAAYLMAAREALRAEPTTDAKANVVFEDFEGGNYDNWTVEGEAFGNAPQTLATIAHYQGKINAQGKFFVNSHNIRPGGNVRRGDSLTGVMTSKEFTVTLPFIDFWVGGGGHKDQTCVNLLVDGKPVRTATGRNNNQMFAERWDVKELQGKTARIQVVDAAKAGWGNIGVDHIVFANRDAATPQAMEDFSGKYQEKLHEIAGEHKLDADRLARWVAHLLRVQEQPDDPLYAWAKIARKGDASTKDVLAELATRESSRRQAVRKALEDAEIVVDYRQPGAEMIPDGVCFGEQTSPAGQIMLGATEAGLMQGVTRFAAVRRDPDVQGLRLAGGVAKDAGRLSKWDRAGRAFRTNTFEIKRGKLFYLVRGAGMAYSVVDSHRMLNGPLHGSLTREFQTNGEYQWIEHNVGKYPGHRIHVEFVSLADKPLEVVMVVQADKRPGDILAEHPLRKIVETTRTPQAAVLASELQTLLLDTSRKLGAAQLRTIAECSLADWFVANSELFPTGGDRKQQLQAASRSYLKRRSALVAQLKLESRTAMAMWDGDAENERLLIRGNHKTPGKVVPRRLLKAIGGAQEEMEQGSGRLELARRVLAPENPFASRVMANRVWHHLTGRGIVASVDNFGVLGQAPTHPQLLDHLATQFRREGWSVKRLIKTIVLSKTYQMASALSAEGSRLDPNNELLHRTRVRRLQGEAIRDAMLAVSGRLDATSFGPAVPVYLTSFMQGRGRPKSGPLDGAGRRSIYISVRRNFLSPMMLAFDTPQPFNSVGRRNVSNVPAQALILMNDPFVIEQARVWARRLLSDKGLTAQERIERMYLLAFARSPTEQETAEAIDFLQQQTAQLGGGGEQALTNEQAWGDLCHVMFNVKEFIFVH